MVGAILGGFTILGVFLTVAAWVNGRSIKKHMGGLIKEIGDLIKEESKLTREVLVKMDERHTELLGKILGKVTK